MQPGAAMGLLQLGLCEECVGPRALRCRPEQPLAGKSAPLMETHRRSIVT
jgi:hypothetical protein